MRLDTCSHDGMTYEPGDHLCVHPQNNAKIVDALLALVKCGVDINSLVYIKTKSKGI